MKKNINLSGFTKKERAVAIEEIEHAVNHNGGWINDFQMFGENAISVFGEVEYQDLEQVVRAISGVVRLDAPVEEKVEEVRLLKGMEGEEIGLTLYFTFQKKPKNIDEEPALPPKVNRTFFDQ